MSEANGAAFPPIYMKGFTLIELVLMVAILGIMVVLYIESAGDLSDVAIDAAARKVQADIRYAQQLARSTSTTHGANFTAGGSYEVYKGSPGHPIVDPVTRGNLIEDFSRFPGVSVESAFRVEYNAAGRPVVGGDGRVRLVADSGARRDVYIVDETGAVVVDFLQKGTGCKCTLCRISGY